MGTPFLELLGPQQGVDEVDEQHRRDDAAKDVFDEHGGPSVYRRSQPKAYAIESAKNPRPAASRITSSMGCSFAMCTARPVVIWATARALDPIKMRGRSAFAVGGILAYGRIKNRDGRGRDRIKAA